MKTNNKVYFAIPVILLVIALIFIATNFLSLETTPAVSDVNKKIPAQTPQQNIPQGEDALKADIAQREAVDNAQVSPPSDASIESADAKRERLIRAALRAVNSKNVESRLYGIQVLAFYDPDMAVSEMYEAFVRIKSEPDIEGMIILGALKLAHDETHFDSNVILDMYEHTDSDNIKGRLARILSFRGDDSVLVNYLSEIKPKLTNGELSQKNDLLLMLGSVESKLTIPYIKPYLSDPDERVRLSALTALSYSANVDELELVEPMLLDESEHVRYNANVVVSYLTAKGKSMPLPADISASGSEGENTF